MGRELLSVCIATFNGEKYIKQQIDSIISQLSDGDEIVISDDGSTDNTVSIIKDYKRYVRLVETEKIGGVVKNFERALNYSRNEIIILADQDDVWCSGRVAIIKKELMEYDLIVLNGELVDSKLRPTGITVFDSVSMEKGFFRNIKKNTYVGCCMAFRRSVLDVAMPFPALIEWHDWYIGLVAELIFKVGQIDEIGLLFRRHDANASSTGLKSKNSIAIKIKIRLIMIVAVFYSVIIRRKIRKFF
jgi:glycosyltransferase involved in cell wall biosynthesis